MFNTFVAKTIFFMKKWGPRFLHTFIAFWLDFQGLGLPGSLKKKEKTACGNDHFLKCLEIAFFTKIAEKHALPLDPPPQDALKQKKHTKSF